MAGRLRKHFLPGSLPTTGDAKYEFVTALPDGIAVRHFPQQVRAVDQGTKPHRYLWKYRTEVSSEVGKLTIVEFGCFVKAGNHWVLNQMGGEPFTPQQFAQWYSCPEARLLQFQRVSDPRNWGAGDELSGSTSLWYYIGQDATGNQFKGMGAVEELPLVME